MDNQYNSKPELTVGLVVKNSIGQTRTIISVCKQGCTTGKCPSGQATTYTQTEHHIWFDSGTFTLYYGQKFWKHYTLISSPESIQELIPRIKTRFELIND